MIKVIKMIKVFTIIIAPMIIVLFFSGCGCLPEKKDTPEVAAAKQRIQNAIDMIEVIAYTNTEANRYSLSEFDELPLIQSSDDKFVKVEVHVNFETILKGVANDDFLTARTFVQNDLNSILYSYIARMFVKTNHVYLNLINSSALEPYQLPPNAFDINRIPVDISFFVESPDNRFQINTGEYGSLDLYSDFFYEYDENDPTSYSLIPNAKDYRLVLGFEEIIEVREVTATGGISEENEESDQLEEDEESDQLEENEENKATEEVKVPVVSFKIEDERGVEKGPRTPGRSVLLSIPLSASFMQDDNGELRYNAVEYIDPNGTIQGILPRSFIDDDYLHVYTNRTGMFRLIKTEHGKPESVDDIEGFLRDRNIDLTGIPENGELFVERGDFYDALMSIHWVENLFFEDLGSVTVFNDMPSRQIPDWRLDLKPEERMWRHIAIGQQLRAFNLVGYGDGWFYPGDLVKRTQMYIIVAGYVKAFEIDVEGWPPISDAMNAPNPNESGYWHEAYWELFSMRFIPYRYTGGVADVAPNGYLTLREAQEIIFKLITTKHFSF